MVYITDIENGGEVLPKGKSSLHHQNKGGGQRSSGRNFRCPLEQEKAKAKMAYEMIGRVCEKGLGWGSRLAAQKQVRENKNTDAVDEPPTSPFAKLNPRPRRTLERKVSQKRMKK